VKLRNKNFVIEDICVVQVGKNLILIFIRTQKSHQNNFQFFTDYFSILSISPSFLLSAGELLELAMCAVQEEARPMCCSALHQSASYSQLALAGPLSIWVNSLLKWVTEVDTTGILSST
jgi:hypothetical protein